MLARLGQIVLAFFLLNLLLSPVNVKTSAVADLLTAVVRVVAAGFVVGKLGQTLSGAGWVRRVWAAIPFVVLAAGVVFVLIAIGQRRPLALGAFAAEVGRDIIELALAFALAVSIERRRILNPQSREASP